MLRQTEIAERGMCGGEGDGTKALGDDVGRRYELGGKCAVAKAERLRRLGGGYGDNTGGGNFF